VPGESTAKLDLAKLPNRLERGIYVSVSEMDAVSPPLPCALTVRRLFKDLRLDGVLYVGRMPRAVFKRVRRVTAEHVRSWQRTVWNHAVTPLLVLLTDTQIWVYSGQSLPAREDQDADADGRLVQMLDTVSDLLELDNLVSTIESGDIFRALQTTFDREHAVDRYLLKNIETAALRLCECEGRSRPLQLEEAHQFLIRLLFACYLVDREMISGKYFPEPSPLARLAKAHGLRLVLDEAEDSKRCAILGQLFRRIGALFNGSMFEEEALSIESGRLSDDHADIVMRFLRGDDLGNGQLSLMFWAYDFRHIPIETVSAVYESFLGDSESVVREETGAYYTPPHLAELVVDTAMEGARKPLLDSVALDPACGSGVFLVAMFNRMAEQWRQRNPGRTNTTRARELRRILRTQLWGIDSNITACHIACFSLYLAYLDQLTPRDVEALRDEGLKLPPLLLPRGERQPSDNPRPIINRNFFETDRQIPQAGFDLIVGNPPWVSRGEVRDAKFLAWLGDGEREVPQKQMACGFMWEVPKLLHEDGEACLVLPSAVLLNRTDRFQIEWFAAFGVEKVINLSDLSFLLFDGADRPAVVIRFSLRRQDGDRPITYLTPKADIASQLRGPVQVHEEDFARVPLACLVQEARHDKAAWLWKTRLWGTARDLRFLQRLGDMPRLEQLAGEPREQKRWAKGQGFQPYSANDEEKKTKKKYGWWGRDHPFLGARNANIHFLVVESDCQSVGSEFDVLRRLPDRKLFEGPKVLIPQGSRNMKAAFCAFPVLFRDSLQSMAGPAEDADLLRFLAAVIHSRLAEYFLFHTSASLGTERDKTHLFELLRLPFPLPADCDARAKAEEIVREVSSRIQELGRRIRADSSGRGVAIRETQQQIDPLVSDYYDVDGHEAILIEDTLRVAKPSSTPTSPKTHVPALREPTSDEQLAYVETICATLRSHAVPRLRGSFAGTIIRSRGAPLAVVTLRRGARSQASREEEGSGPLSRSLSRLSSLLPHGSRSIQYVRNVKVIEKECVHIVKPLALRSWTRTAALNDADEVFNAILMKKAGS